MPRSISLACIKANKAGAVGAQLTRISGKTPLANAISYAITRITRIKRLRPYLDHGLLEIDNNTAERGMGA
jgi:transposase